MSFSDSLSPVSRFHTIGANLRFMRIPDLTHIPNRTPIKWNLRIWIFDLAFGLISQQSLFSPILSVWLLHGTKRSSAVDYNSIQSSVIDSLKRPPSSFDDSPINLTNQALDYYEFYRIPLKFAFFSASLTLAKTDHSNLVSVLPSAMSSFAFLRAI
jgi:hypothetical protein